MAERRELHPNRQVQRDRFTTTAADAGAHASDSLGYQELGGYAADYARQGKTMPDWLHKEMGYDD